MFREGRFNLTARRIDRMRHGTSNLQLMLASDVRYLAFS